MPADGLDHLARLDSRQARQRSREDERAAAQRSLARGLRTRRFEPMHSGLPKRCDHLPIVRLVEEPADRLGHHRADIGHLEQARFIGREQRVQASEVRRQRLRVDSPTCRIPSA